MWLWKAGFFLDESHVHWAPWTADERVHHYERLRRGGNVVHSCQFMHLSLLWIKRDGQVTTICTDEGRLRLVCEQ